VVVEQHLFSLIVKFYFIKIRLSLIELRHVSETGYLLTSAIVLSSMKKLQVTWTLSRKTLEKHLNIS